MIVWLAMAAVTLAVLALLLAPLWRSGPTAGPAGQGSAGNRAALRAGLARLQAVEADVGAGRAGETEAAALRSEAGASLLALDRRPEDPERPAGPALRRLLAALILFAVPALAMALYLHHGRPDLPGQPHAARPVADTVTRADIEAMVNRLARRLATETPEDVAGWRRLGQVYTVMGRHRAAADAWGRAVALEAGHADSLVGQALALLRAGPAGDTLPADVVDLMRRAADLDPRHVEALWFAGLGALEAGDRAGANDYWQRLHSLLPAGSEEHRLVGERLEAIGGSRDRAPPRPGARPARN